MFRRLNRLLPSSRCKVINNKYYQSQLSKIPQSTTKKSSTKIDDDMTLEDVIAKENRAHVEQRKRYKYPQQQLADTYVLTTNDKIEFVSEHTRRIGYTKKMPIACLLGAFVAGKVGWYQFDFLGMPSELEIVMVHLPILFVGIHWLSFYPWVIFTYS